MSYYNLQTDSIENKFLKIEYLIDRGPRIVRLIYKPTKVNLLAEVPGVKLNSPYGEYTVHGGHRVWAAPESPEFTYIPDDNGLTVSKGEGHVRLTGAVEFATGLQKTIEIELVNGAPEVNFRHTLTNKGSNPVTCALWVITMLPAGGSATMPLRGRPGSPLQADRQIGIWPYTRLNDPRLQITDEELRININDRPDIFKIGSRCPQGWLTYLYNGILFRKEFKFDHGAIYQDMGCNAEIYTDGKIIELESLSGLVTLNPSQSIRHDETWKISFSQ